MNSVPRYARSTSKRIKLSAALVLVVLAATAITVGVARSGGETPPAAPTAAALSLADRFAVLSRARSNQCGLQANGLAAMAANGHLQGSCCSRMDLHRYREQLQGLRRYRDVPEIPRDPYDIPVSLAKRLFAYQQTIELTPAEQRIYDKAMKLADVGGPCCCRCWRWTAFEGQAKFLIRRRGYTAKQIAEVWTLEDGCGGAGHNGEHHS